MHVVLFTVLLGCPSLTGFIDRIEGPRAVLLTPRRTLDIPARCLPRAAREGTFLVRGAVDGRAFRLEIREVRRLQEEALRPRGSPVPLP